MNNHKTLKVAICDDNSQDRNFLYNMCKLIKERKGFQIKLKEYESGDSLLFDMEDSRIMTTVDIVLLDTHMPDSYGINVARRLREYGYQGAIIFVTKSTEHWREAFDVEAFNYITKDEDVENRFLNVFMRAVEKVANSRGKTLLFSSVGETRQIDIHSISRFEADNYLITVYYDNEKFDFVSSLSKIESLLYGNDDFVRVNRAHLVSIPHIEKIEDNNAIMFNGEIIPVSARQRKALKDAITKRL